MAADCLQCLTPKPSKKIMTKLAMAACSLRVRPNMGGTIAGIAARASPPPHAIEERHGPDPFDVRGLRIRWTGATGIGYDMRMHRWIAFLAAAGCFFASGVFAQESIDAELQRSSDEHMREELGVNPITTPSIQEILKQLEVFRPIPIALINSADREATFNNRLQTALHFGSLVADGFLLTLAERPQDIQDVGKALIRQARALGVGERLTKRSKSLFELSDKGDWLGMREELVRTQSDVESAMLELRDEEMAHMISLGGWLRGFQLGANSTADAYSPAKAEVLGNTEIMDYFLDRLSTLHPRLKKTEIVTALTARIKEIRELAAEADGKPLAAAQVEKIRKLADEAEAAAVARVDEDGRFEKKKKN